MVQNSGTLSHKQNPKQTLNLKAVLKYVEGLHQKVPLKLIDTDNNYSPKAKYSTDKKIIIKTGLPHVDRSLVLLHHIFQVCF